MFKLQLGANSSCTFRMNQIKISSCLLLRVFICHESGRWIFHLICFICSFVLTFHTVQLIICSRFVQSHVYLVKSKVFELCWLDVTLAIRSNLFILFLKNVTIFKRGILLCNMLPTETCCKGFVTLESRILLTRGIEFNDLVLTKIMTLGIHESGQPNEHNPPCKTGFTSRFKALG